jgi:cysteine-rich secretory family protein
VRARSPKGDQAYICRRRERAGIIAPVSRPFVIGLAVVLGIVALVYREASDKFDPTGEPTACGQTQREPRELGVERTQVLILCLLNEERARRGLAPLRRHPLLERAALLHSQDMVQRGFFEHDTPEGRTPQDRILATGYVTARGRATGENLAWGEGFRASPNEIVKGWMNSLGHKKNILRSQFDEIGIGIVLAVPSLDGEASGDGATFTTTFGGPVGGTL